jgi:hypothetical protein
VQPPIANLEERSAPAKIDYRSLKIDDQFSLMQIFVPDRRSAGASFWGSDDAHSTLTQPSPNGRGN